MDVSNGYNGAVKGSAGVVVVNRGSMRPMVLGRFSKK